MTSNQILLILISGLGVLHGLYLAVFLWVYKKGNVTSNKLLSLLLLVLSFRVGKSVFLEFTEDLDIQFILTGLAGLMAIGPLFYFYTRSLVESAFIFRTKYLVHFIPALLGVAFGLLINNQHVNTIPKVIFLFIFITYYGHYICYLVISYRLMSKEKKAGLDDGTYQLLRLLFFALLAIWFVYVLNLFDDFIPYIIAPILYTLVAYTISFIVIKKGYIQSAGHTKYKTTPISDERATEIFAILLKCIVDEQQYKNPDLSLKLLSQQLKVSSQVLSMVVNQQSKMNFNSLINHYRIEEAMKIFQSKSFLNHTIAAIAFDAGFNSISSFNAAFQKQTGKTPSAFRNQEPK